VRRNDPRTIAAIPTKAMVLRRSRRLRSAAELLSGARVEGALA
jgi:hypothetical protein